ncbi:MAG: hypothetical protein ACLRVS_05625 [Lachnospiraceae bacterium]
MPTTYAHYKFGKEVISASGPLRSTVENHRELFDIGFMVCLLSSDEEIQ